MISFKRSSLVLAVALGSILIAGCDNSSSSGGAGSAAPTAKSSAPAPATATATAAPTAAAPAGAVVGIAAGEIVGGSCNTIDKDSECGEFVVKSDADKAKSMEALKMLCKGKIDAAACPTDKMVGTCRSGKDIINHYYSDGPKTHTADTAKKACEKGMGRWVTP